jgi:hypothetical protein
MQPAWSFTSETQPDVGGLDAGARLQREQALREQRLRMDAGERAGVLLPLAARRAHGVDDPRLAHRILLAATQPPASDRPRGGKRARAEKRADSISSRRAPQRAAGPPLGARTGRKISGVPGVDALRVKV